MQLNEPRATSFTQTSPGSLKPSTSVYGLQLAKEMRISKLKSIILYIYFEVIGYKIKYYSLNPSLGRREISDTIGPVTGD
jgi:hypothetical protein